ncbi:MAG: thiol peroxidase [Defluviitaleaceae bacterium]|nr:thiol peroxidase [Defluviitaleaceae bacterium]
MKITFKGNPLTLSGSTLNIGDVIKDFTVTKNDLSPLALADTKGVRIFLSVPSLDTPVCDMEVRKFNEKAADISGVTIYVVSMDLPFAQARWCGGAGINNLVAVSDYKNASFAKATGTYIEELSLLTRAAFVVNAEGVVTHVEYVEEVTSEPNYEAILEAAKKA